MIRLVSSILLFLIPIYSHAQYQKGESESIADCEGAINLFKSGNYSVQFTGKPGYVDDLKNYPSLSDISKNNILWISFIADEDGVVSFDANIHQNYLQMIIFQQTKSNVCSELSKGTADIKRLYKGKDQHVVGLDSNVAEGKLYPLELLAGQKIMIAFTTVEKAKSVVKLDFKFRSTNTSKNSKLNEQKIIDNRQDDFATTLSFIARDKITNAPVVANFVIDNNNQIGGLYHCSDLLLNPPRPSKIKVRCDAEGYFFMDKEVLIINTSDQEVLFNLDPIAKGKSMQIEEIEFKPGTSEILGESEPKLRRLRDFLALNSDLNIEIQGHVFFLGENNSAAQKMSEVRAKRVMNYLVENGIDKNRLTAVGYGNTLPIYVDPKFSYEEQANRRVEILVK